MTNCQHCHETLKVYNQEKVTFSICCNFQCKNIVIKISKNESIDEDHVYNIITHGALTEKLKISLSLLVYAPEIFRDSPKSIVSEISEAYRKSTKQFVTLFQQKEAINKLRTELSFVKQHEDYLFANTLNHLLSKLDIVDTFAIKYVSTIKCTKCRIDFSRPLKGNAILIPSRMLSVPTAVENKLSYEIECSKCRCHTPVELDLVECVASLSVCVCLIVCL